MTSTFKVGTASRFGSPSFPGCAGNVSTFFVLYLNDLPSGALSLILSISSLIIIPLAS